MNMEKSVEKPEVSPPSEGQKRLELPDDSGVKPRELNLPDDSGVKPRELNLPDDSGNNNSCINIESSGEITRGSYQEKIDGQLYYYDDEGKLYRVGDDLMPNTEYKIGQYKYMTDDLGRIVSAEGTLRVKTHEGRLPIKDSIETIGKGDQLENDDRGHLIGDQFDGSNGLENMIPQDANINRNDYKKFENELANEVKSGSSVTMKVEPRYEGDSRRPSQLIVTYSINGEENVKIFPNNSEVYSEQ